MRNMQQSDVKISNLEFKINIYSINLFIFMLACCFILSYESYVFQSKYDSK